MNHKTQTAEELFSTLSLSNHRIITIVGAGGKTTLLYSLADHLSASNKKILLTTTTHIKRPSVSSCHSHWILVEEEKESMIAEGFSNSSVVCLGIPVQKQKEHSICSASPADKWQAPSLSFLNKIKSIPDYILCEGDGSKRLPVKIPRNGEPVLFPDTDLILGVIGLSCLNQPIEKVLFGWQTKETKAFFHSLLPTTTGGNHRITPDTLFHIATSNQGLLKSTKKTPVHIILNQADTLSDLQLDEIEKTMQKIRDNGTSCHIVSLKKS